MIVLGIDPGYGRCGFGVIESNESAMNGWSHLASGVISTSAETEFSDRLLEIGDDLVSIIRQYKPELLVIEQLFFAKNTTTAMKVAHARGMIVYVAKKEGVRVEDVMPNEVKQALTGYGAADKKQMQEMVKTVFGLSKVPEPDDAADALAIAWTGATRAAYL
ncbi:crossover junction endodeoxyribonuclease RuvC [Candidatus Uhrbacteria bacterium]|jgi:crossover junction endodeoxyribonuclease RuvC|nr:crossover junction endodeoxyribonuclease RuvC [Candidatus Uhrbacteria bacterium]